MSDTFKKLPTFSGDPFFTLEPMAVGRVIASSDVRKVPSMDELLAVSRRPQDVIDLHGLEACYDSMPLLVLKATDVTEAGFCYVADEYPALDEAAVAALIVINPLHMPAGMSVRDLFLHEVTHVYTGEEHGFEFLSVLNALRARAGLEPSRDPYDVRDGLNIETLPDLVNMDLELASELCSIVGLRLAEDMGHSRSALLGSFKYKALIGGVFKSQMTRDQFLVEAKRKIVQN